MGIKMLDMDRSARALLNDLALAADRVIEAAEKQQRFAANVLSAIEAGAPLVAASRMADLEAMHHEVTVLARAAMRFGIAEDIVLLAAKGDQFGAIDAYNAAA